MLAVDAFLIASWRWGRHSTWSSITPWAIGLLLLTTGIAAYTWWWHSDPQRQDRARILREERAARQQLK
ncbi:hypothetical protein SCOCK_180132 [Actinacidiphila cocklensis]|uniref:Uncharacterized protein n=2 Tax=Actinacidiphila cocklensis TaxID=887465 RepID=A0A9W4DMM7_9ACTN|nr:hypothetical protein SCOCK_180132 [Actinacidiphila cocklensis]